MTFIFLYILSIYQDDILYLRNIPIRHIYDNPKSYQSPAERDMNYLPITIDREDGVKLKGWFINNVDEEGKNCVKIDRRTASEGLKRRTAQLVETTHSPCTSAETTSCSAIVTAWANSTG